MINFWERRGRRPNENPVLKTSFFRARAMFVLRREMLRREWLNMTEGLKTPAPETSVDELAEQIADQYSAARSSTAPDNEAG
jgi:hypothetical protein